MDNGNLPAFPITVEFKQGNDDLVISNAGLTKREYFAVVAIAGVLNDQDISPKHAAKFAVECADALIEALND